MSRRSGREVVSLAGEVLPVEDAPVARPVGRVEHLENMPGGVLPDPFMQPQVFIVQTPVPVEPEGAGLRWDRLAAYVAGLVMLLVVLGVLVAAGVIDLGFSAPELVPVQRGPAPDLVGPSR